MGKKNKDGGIMSTDFPEGRLESAQIYPGNDEPDRDRTDLISCAGCGEETAPEAMEMIEGRFYCEDCWDEI